MSAKGTQRGDTYWLQFTRNHLHEIHSLLERYWSLLDDEYESRRCLETILQVLSPLLKHTARSNHQHRENLGLEVEDFLVFAEIAAYKAIVSYRPERNDNFLAYLYFLINNEVIKHIDREIPIPSTVFHRLSEDDSDARWQEHRTACLAILRASSLDCQNDRDRWVAQNPDLPDEESSDSEYIESDGQMVAPDLI